MVILGVCHTLGRIYGKVNLWREVCAGACLRQRSEVMSEEQFVPFIGVSRHRMATDGNGVTTLAAFHGCGSVVAIVSIRSAAQTIVRVCGIRPKRCMKKSGQTSFISSPQAAE